MSKNNHEFYWCLVELPNGKKEWYCISRILRNAIDWEREINHNRYWKKTLIGNYINLSICAYRNNQTRLSVGKICKIKIKHHGAKDWHWTRNQFITPDGLLHFGQAYNYLKHNYSWYNRLAIQVALKHWQVELLQKKIHHFKKNLRTWRHDLV